MLAQSSQPDDLREAGLTFEQLRTFQVIASAGTLTRAAEQLFLTQPAVSQRMRRLEQVLGIELFDRTHGGRKIRLTPAGERVLHFAGAASDLLRQLRSELQEDTSAGARQRISVATTRSLILPALLAAFRQRHPHVEVKEISCSGPEVSDMVARGEADAGFQVAAWIDERLLKVPVLEDRLVLIACAEQAFDGDPGENLAQLVRTPFVLPPVSSYIRHAAEEWAEAVGLQMRVALEAQSFGTIIRAVQHRFGVALLPERMAYRGLCAGDLATVPVTGLPREFQVCMIAAARPQSEATRALLDLARESSWRAALPAEIASLSPPQRSQQTPAARA